MNQSFIDAQQAANVAYDMTIESTGDEAQAADAYKAVMSSYYAAQYPRRVMVSHDTNNISRITVDREWIDSNRSTEPISDLADRVALAYKESELKDYDDWRHIKGDCAL